MKNCKPQTANRSGRILCYRSLLIRDCFQLAKPGKKNNEALFENNQANADLQEQLSELGEAVMPIITAVTQGIANILSWFNNLSPEVQNIIGLVATVITTIAGAAAIIQGITAGTSGFKCRYECEPNIINHYAVAALVAAFIYLWNNREEFREFWIKPVGYHQQRFFRCLGRDCEFLYCYHTGRVEQRR